MLVALLAGLGVMALLRTGPADLLRQAQTTWHSDPAVAERILERSIELSGGDFPQAQLLRCRVLGSLGRWTEALGCFSLIREPAGCDQQELIDLAGEARRAGQDLLAGLSLQAANRPGPRQAAALRELILLERAETATDSLRQHCQELKSLTPDDAFPWQIEAELYRQQRKVLPAIAAYRQALRLTIAADAAQALRSDLVGLLIDAGDLASARTELQTLLDAGKASPELMLKDAYLLRLEGKPTATLAKVDELLSASPSTAARMLRGELYLDLGRHAEAVADLTQVVEEQPSNKEAHYKLSQAYLRLGEREKAQRHLDESQRLTREAVERLEGAGVPNPKGR